MINDRINESYDDQISTPELKIGSFRQVVTCTLVRWFVLAHSIYDVKNNLKS